VKETKTRVVAAERGTMNGITCSRSSSRLRTGREIADSTPTRPTTATPYAATRRTRSGPRPTRRATWSTRAIVLQGTLVGFLRQQR
jgi:hypothetical protein